MFLKRVAISGFKSFADRVDFDFTSGISCIVGPNGCGKSNIVDAIKWVLGEQSAKSLRGRQMVDMIFSGSSTRSSSSVAQVDLVFDNQDRHLRTDHQEVTVTRKLYRSGESDYRVCGERCRLKDIRDLFMDTGLGGNSYAIIEQGQVDRLLQSNPVERRAIFEEAAGISRCKARRKEAQRKLDRTEQNLLRVADIVEELEKRLRSVKLQAGKARSFKEYQARLSELRSDYALAEYHRFTESVDDLAGKIEARTDAATGVRTEMDRVAARDAQLKTNLDAVAEQIGEMDRGLVRARAEIAAREERIRSAHRRVDEQHLLEERASSRLEVDTKRLAGARREIEEHDRSIRQLDAEQAVCGEKTAQRVSDDRALARNLSEAQAVLEDEKAGLIDLLRQSAAAHNDIIRLATHQESLVGHKSRLHQRDAHLASELRRCLEEKASLELQVREVQTLIEREMQSLEEKKAQTQRADELRQRFRTALAETKEQRSALESRRELLDDLEQKMDGVGAGVRRLLSAKESADKDPAADAIRGLLADVFETDVTHAPIIEAILGEADQALLISDSRILTARTELFADLPERLTVLCLDRLPPVINERSFEGEPGFVARAIDLVRYADEYDHLARHVFAKTILVDSLATAIRLAGADVCGHRFATLAGEIVDADSRIWLGSTSSRAGLISRKSELKDIGIQLSIADEQITKLSDQLNRADAEVAHLEGVQQELRNAIYESNTAKVEAGTAVQSIAEGIRRLTGEQPLIAQEVALLEQEISEIVAKSAERDQSLEAMQSENQQREERTIEHQQRIDAVVADRLVVQEELTKLRVELGQLGEKRAAAADAIQSLRVGIGEFEQSVAAAQLDVEQCGTRIVEAREEIDKTQASLATLEEQADHAQQRANELRKQRELLRIELEELGEAAKLARSNLDAVEAHIHEHQMALTEVTVRRDELSARVTAELQIDLAERYQAYEHHDKDWSAVEAEIAELRGKIDRLGHVNLDAINELDELQGRHDFLAAQCEDLSESRLKLLRLIEQLDVEAAQRFLKTFNDIREHFRGLFRRLFGGGRADVILLDPDDVLESGVEVVAQPPGKDLQSITLMSGGEKSLTAIALVMSMFQSRPAPFAILDEVDAALDEANNERFNRLIEEFVKKSQFVIITHSKRTMSIADQLFGVTMQEPGVSTRVSVRLADAHVA